MAERPWSFLDLLNEDPQLAYFASLYGGDQRLSQNQRGFFGNRFGDIYNQYLGTLGEGLKTAQSKGLKLHEYLNDPALSTKFTDYLNQQSFGQRWGQMAPSQRPGGGIAQFAPPVRWLSR